MESGGTPKSSNKTYYDGNIPFLSISDISGNKLYKTKKFISESGLSNSSTKIIKENNIIYTMYATPGIAFLNHIDVAIPQSVISIELKDNFNTLFVLNLLNFYRNNILSLAMTGTQSNLTGEIVKNIKVKIPSIEEQNKVENLLSSIDILIELQNNITNNCIKKKKYFSNKLVYKNTNTNKFILSDVVEHINNDKVVSTNKYKKIIVCLHNKGIKFLIGNSDSVDKRPFYLRKKGEIIIGKQNYFNGSIAIIKQEFDNCISSNAIVCFKIKEDFSTYFIYELLSNVNFLEKRKALANGTGQKELSEKELFSFKIYLPKLKEQQKVTELLSSMDNLINKLMLMFYYIIYKGLSQKGKYEKYK